MKNTLMKIPILLLTAAFLSACGRSVLQAPAFYVSPAVEQQAKAPAAEVNPEEAKKTTVQQLGQQLVDTMSIGVAQLPLPEAPAKDVLPPQPMPNVPTAEKAPVSVQPPVPAQAPQKEVLLPVPQAPQLVRLADTAQALPPASLPRLEDMPPERRLQILEETAEKESLEIIVRAAPAQKAPAREREPREISSQQRGDDALRPLLQEERRSQQLLEEQNRLLRQQLDHMQAQQRYYQQQNERFMKLALDERQKTSPLMAVEPERNQPVVYEPEAEVDYSSTSAGPPVDSAYARMEAQLSTLSRAVAGLQLALQENKKADTLQSRELPEADASQQKADTALLSTVEALRQQLKELQESGKDSLPQLAPLNVYFASGAAGVSAEGMQELEVWAMQAKSLPPTYNIVLNGFTDKRGPAELNLRLANKRIQAVKTALIDLGVPPARILSGYVGIDLEQQDLAHARRVQLVLRP